MAGRQTPRLFFGLAKIISGGPLKTVLSALLAFFLVLAGNDALAQINDINAAINKAGRQRMLSQRMAKAYFQIGQQIDVDRSKKVLDSSIAAFDRQLVELKNYAPTPEIKETYLKLEKSWLAYKDALIGVTPSPENGRKVLAISEEVLALAQQGTVQLEKKSGSVSGHLVNISGRQRMLSQRMAKFYQAASWGVADDKSSGNLDKARKDFAEALLELSTSPANTVQIKESLDLVKQQWFFFENALSQKSGVDKRPQLAVATTSERILDEMEGVVGLYEKLQK
jgi:nitrate/nitrite-specific signal transduction histidine kinase